MLKVTQKDDSVTKKLQYKMLLKVLVGKTKSINGENWYRFFFRIISVPSIKTNTFLNRAA